MKRASSDVGLIMTCYNLRRLINVIGITALIEFMLTKCTRFLAYLRLNRPKLVPIKPWDSLKQNFSIIIENCEESLYLKKLLAA